jgi:hypothetical protein
MWHRLGSSLKYETDLLVQFRHGGCYRAMKAALDSKRLFSAAKYLLHGQFVDHVTSENFIQQGRVIDVCDQMNLRADVLIFLFDTQFMLLLLHQTLCKRAPFDIGSLFRRSRMCEHASPSSQGFSRAQCIHA